MFYCLTLKSSGTKNIYPDFTLIVFENFLLEFNKNEYTFIKYNEFINSRSKNNYNKLLILRHDIDNNPKEALKIAEIENKYSIKTSFYFGTLDKNYNLEVMNKIASLGHEIGYHYEDIDLAVKKFKLQGIKNYTTNDLIDEGYKIFCDNLAVLRKNFEIKTICMHGSPRSKYDNKLLWSKYNYKDLGIIGEPYYDIDFNKFGYFTDTGRRWNGGNVSVRDKVNSIYTFNFKTTQQIVENIDKLPNYLMFTVHPQRWTNSPYLWGKELIAQNIKNIVKKIIVK